MSRRQFALPERDDDQPPDDTGCTVLHVDMDAFYASASLLSRPELVGTPVIIGGGTRGVVLSATYEARRFGVASAMPMTRARRLCPQATIIQPDHRLYSRISDAVMATFATVTPSVEPLSLDEAFLDVAGSLRRMGSPAQIGQWLRDTIADEQGITASVGVAPTKFVAKLASGLAKPDGMVVVPAAEVVSFVQQLPVGALWGVGDKTEAALQRLGLHTVADIAHTPVDVLQRSLGDVGGRHLFELSWGRDPRFVEPVRRERSIGADETFERDVDDPAYIHRELLRLAERTAARVRAAGLMGRTVSIKVRFADFTTITRSRTLRDPTDVGHEIYDVARSLFDALGLKRVRVRLVGVRMEQLVERSGAPLQATLDEPETGWREADRAVDRASARFGAGSVRPATLLGGGPRRDDTSHPTRQPGREGTRDGQPARRQGPSGGAGSGTRPGDLS